MDNEINNKNNSKQVKIVGVAAGVLILILLAVSVFQRMKINELNSLYDEKIEKIRDKGQKEVSRVYYKMVALRYDYKKLEESVNKYKENLRSLDPETVKSLELAAAVTESIKPAELGQIDPKQFENMDPQVAIKEMQKQMEELEQTNKKLDELLAWNAVGASISDPDKMFGVIRIEDLQQRAHRLELKSIALADGEEKKTFDLKNGEKKKVEEGWYVYEFMLESKADTRIGALEINCKTENEAEILDVEFTTEANARNMEQGYVFENAKWNRELPKRTGWTARIGLMSPHDIKLNVITSTDPGDIECRYSVEQRQGAGS